MSGRWLPKKLRAKLTLNPYPYKSKSAAGKGIGIMWDHGAGDGNRTNTPDQNKGVTARFTVQLESNGVKSLTSY